MPRSCPRKFCICIFSPCILIFHAIRIYLCACLSMGCSMVWQHIQNCCCACWACLCCKCCGCTSQFTDGAFPPCQESLGGAEQMNVEWHRLDEILGGDDDVFSGEVAGQKKSKKRLQLFEDGIKSSDVSQGGLGDCWLMAAIAALAEYPSIIQSIFLTKRYSTYGKYTLQLYDAHQESYFEMDVDNYIPCTGGSRPRPIYAGTHDEMWVVLLEKAVAKYCDNYNNLKGGRTEWAMNFLTGYPVFVLRMKSPNDTNAWHRCNMEVEKIGSSKNHRGSTWKPTKENFSAEDIFYIVREYDERGAIMCTETYEGSDTDTNEHGIVQGHAYTLIGARKVDDFMLLQCRNPWGTGEWTGAWGDKSTMWDRHPNVKKELDFKPKNDGSFWITMDDFVKNFDAVTICVRETGFTDLNLDPHEHLGCCGVCVGCVCGCANYWCCCQGCKALCCGEDADDETVKGKRDSCCPCCPHM